MAPARLPTELQAHSSVNADLNTVNHPSLSQQDREETIKSLSVAMPCQMIVQEEHHSDSANLEKLVQTNNPIPNKGYGDFCFGRRIDTLYHESSRPYYYPEWTESNDASPSSLNSHPCSEPFKFSNLPVETRHQIYGLLLAPFYYLPPSEGGPKLRAHIKVHIEINEPGYRYLPQPELEVWLTNMYHDVKERDLERTDMDEQRARSLRKSAQHPTRSSNYLLRVRCFFRKLENGYLSRYAFLNWVRQASNVSKGFRRELGEVFWARTYISVGNFFSHGDLSHLIHFLNDRPAAHSGLVFDSASRQKTAIEHFPGFCALTKKLKLEKLKITIVVNAEDLEDMAEGNGRFACLSACKDCIVTKGFRLSVNPQELIDEHHYDGDSSEEQEFLGSMSWPLVRDYFKPDMVWEERLCSRSLSKEYGPLMQEYMMPDILRKSQGLTTEQRYLKARDSTVEKEEDNLSHHSSD